jgi:hypothetical protein
VLVINPPPDTRPRADLLRWRLSCRQLSALLFHSSKQQLVEG